jgi:hypothetical protein
VVLRRFGVRSPLRLSRLHALLALRLALWRLRGRRIEAALQPMRAPDSRWLAPLAVTGVASSTMARVSVHLVTLVLCWVISCNLRRGYVSRPAYSLASFATYLQLIAGDTEESERIEKTALTELARRPDPVYGPRTEFNIHALLRPWRMPRRQALAPLEGIAGALQEVGDVEYFYYSRFLKVFYCALAGDPIAPTGQALAELATGIRRSGHLYPAPEVCQKPYLLLAAADLRTLESELAASEAEIAAVGGSVEPYVRTAWLMLLCVYGRWDLAFAQSEALGDRLFWLVPYVHVADHCFHRGLAAAALAGPGRGAARRRYRRALRQSLRRLRRWEKAGPDFTHMVELLQAEQAWLARDLRRARVLFERAARRAMQQEFPNHAALAHERLGRMLVDLRRKSEASSAFAQAISLYRDWGAAAKASMLEAEQQSLRSQH